MQEGILTIRTLECDICHRYDSIMLTIEEADVRIQATEMGIGAYSILHNDHTRIIYFDIDGKFLGDTIAMTPEEIPEDIRTIPIPFYIRNSAKNKWFTKIRKSLFSKLHTKNLSITVAGPSRSGKTSIVRYLETLIPERDSFSQTSVPTMGKSTKRFKLGNSFLKTLDMGGQQDFWDLWKEPIKTSDLILFLCDGTSNNVLEVAQAFERVMHYKKAETYVLVILNKKDLILRGEAKKFVSSGEFLSLTNLKLPLPNILAIEASVFEGIAYLPTDLEETSLAEVIINFLQEFS